MEWFSKKRIYLDWAASAPVRPQVARAYSRALVSGNPSSAHTEGRIAKDLLETARTSIARELQVKPDDVIFTSGATEANNLAIQGVIKKWKVSNPNTQPHVLYLGSAHASTVKTIQGLTAFGVVAEEMPIKDGEIDIKKLSTMIRPETALVSMDFVCSETGTIWNTREVRQALPKQVLLHVDASQAPLEESVERSRLGGDLITLDSGKIGAVRGTGVLVAPRTLSVAPLFFGGGQERAMRAGTESVAGVVAFAVALTACVKERDAFSARALVARANLISRVQHLSAISIHQGKKGIAHILNISLVDRDTDYLAALLDEAGFAVSTKSACESDSTQGSRAVFALTGEKSHALSTLRISWGYDTTERDLIRFSKALGKAVAFIDAHHV